MVRKNKFSRANSAVKERNFKKVFSALFSEHEVRDGIFSSDGISLFSHINSSAESPWNLKCCLIRLVCKWRHAVASSQSSRKRRVHFDARTLKFTFSVRSNVCGKSASGECQKVSSQDVVKGLPPEGLARHNFSYALKLTLYVSGDGGNRG